MSSCVPWDFEDSDGLNPFGKPGSFEFNVWYEIDYPASECPAYYGDVPTLEIIGVTCTWVQFDGENQKPRRATADEREQLSDWFNSYVDSHLDEYEAIKDYAFQYSFQDADDDSNDR